PGGLSVAVGAVADQGEKLASLCGRGRLPSSRSNWIGTQVRTFEFIKAYQTRTAGLGADSSATGIERRPRTLASTPKCLAHEAGANLFRYRRRYERDLR